MKGPGGRWKYDLRRVWECPHCGKRDFTSGQVVQRACRCSESMEAPTWMRLVEEARPRGALPPQEKIEP